MTVNASAFHPKFVAAMESLKRIPQDRIRNNPAASALFEQVVQYAPEYLQKIFMAKAREMGLLPDPEFYAEDGEPVYTTGQLASHLGISLEEANRLAREIGEEHPDLANADCSPTVYRRQ